MVVPLETWIGNELADLLGSPILAAGFILLAFFGFITLQGLRLDGKVAIAVGAVIIAATFMPILLLPLGLVSAFLLFLALNNLRRN